jgi:hypothetical protein
MEPDQLTAQPDQPTGCLNCGFSIIEKDYPTPLCKDCREKFIKFPIPGWIKIFAAAIAIVLLLSMVSLTKNFSIGLHWQKAKNAEKTHRYLTAKNELQQVVKSVPDFVEAKTQLMISSFYTEDLQTFVEMSSQLQGVNIEDADDYALLTEMYDRMGKYLPSDSFTHFINAYHIVDSIPETVYKDYLQSFPDEIFPAIHYCSKLMDKDQYATCDSLLDRVLQKDDHYLSALGMKSSLKREIKQFDSSFYYCDKILSTNAESTYAMSSRARTFLKEYKDDEGLKWALKSFEIDKTDSYSKATLALAYHFTNNKTERDKLLQSLKNDTLATWQIKYVNDIIEGRENFR